MEEDKILIDKKLVEIKDEIKLILDPNYYSNKFANIKIDTLNNTIDSANYRFKKELQALPKTKYLEEQLNDMVNALDGKYANLQPIKAGPRFTAAVRSGWGLIKGNFNTFQSELTKDLFNDSLIADVSHKDVILKSNEVALLITYLRQTKMITKNLPDQRVCQIFHELTGFSPIQLSHKIAGSAKYERNLITDLESNYNKLQELLQSIIKLIDDDKRKAILKKDK